MNNDFGPALAAFMQHNSLTQQEVAYRTGMGQSVVSRLLRSTQPEMPTINKIEKGLNVTIVRTDDGRFLIEALDRPASFECTAFHSDIDRPGCVHFTMFEKTEGKQVCEATLCYKLDASEPYELSFKRQEWIPGYVSDAGLLRWAKQWAMDYLRSSPQYAATE